MVRHCNTNGREQDTLYYPKQLWEEEMDTLEIVQFYETTLKAREPEFAMHFLAVPARCIAQEHQERLAHPKVLLEEFIGLLSPQELPLSLLPQAFLAMLENDNAEQARNRLQEVMEREPFERVRREKPELVAFAEYLAFAPIIPFEESKLSEHSFAEVVIKSLEKIGAAATGALTAVAVPVLVGAGLVPPVLWFAGGTVAILAAIDTVGMVFSWKEHKEINEEIRKLREAIEKLTGIRRQASEDEVRRAAQAVSARP
jgi:hypothetical protein